jgi:hypothetical protein
MVLSACAGLPVGRLDTGTAAGATVRQRRELQHLGNRAARLRLIRNSTTAPGRTGTTPPERYCEHLAIAGPMAATAERRPETTLPL